MDPEQPILPSGGAAGRARRGRTAPPLCQRFKQAQEDLAKRPRVSIRLRLVVSLVICFFATNAFLIGSLEGMREAKPKLGMVERLERLDDQLLRVRTLLDERRLAASDVQGVLQRVAELRSYLEELHGSPKPKGWQLPAVERHVRACRRALVTVRRKANPATLFVSSPELNTSAIAASQELGGYIVQERAAIDRALGTTRPLILIVVLFLLFGLISAAFTHALMTPIRRFQEYTARIARGDFSFIRRARSFRDEFTDLAIAVNQMLVELRLQQDRMVESARLAATGTLTSGIAHQLNNPLNNISITAESLMERYKALSDDEKWQHLQDIYLETERAGDIVKRLLDFTRTEKPELISLDPRELVESTVHLVQNEMKLNNVNLIDEMPRNLPHVRGAFSELREVFVNLLLNAVQAMPAGGTIRIRAASHDSNHTCIDIQDSGTGIPEEALPRIFDPFFTTKAPGQGTGLGLSVSIGIVRKLGGDIQIHSEKGRGTTAHVCLPREDAPASNGNGAEA